MASNYEIIMVAQKLEGRFFTLEERQAAIRYIEELRKKNMHLSFTDGFQFALGQAAVGTMWLIFLLAIGGIVYWITGRK